MYRGIKPADQPRSLRSVAEAGNSPKGFPPLPAMPEPQPFREAPVEPPTARRLTPADKNPFGKLR